MKRGTIPAPVHAACRACGTATRVILDLGQSPIANALLIDPAMQPATHRLGLSQCDTCGLVQNLVQLATETLFGGDYPYYSGVSQMVRQHFNDLAGEIAKRSPPGAIALEIGSNDGTMQLALARHGIRCIGIDPAAGPVSLATKAGCKAYCGILDNQMAVRLTQEIGLFDIVTLSNVLAHVSEPVALLKHIRDVLQTDGLLVIEVQSWLALVGSGSFDMVYHEHHSHFSLSSLAWALGQAGFGIQMVRNTATQGGSLRVFCRMDASHSPAVQDRIEAERDDISTAPARLHAHFEAFKVSVRAFGKAMRGKSVAGYGAAAKTVTLLASSMGDVTLTCVADRAPSKIGRYLPINGIPIVSPDAMLATRPDAIILFAWNLRDEILPTLRGHDVWVPLPQFARAS